jgi:hypothetical protein
MASPRETSLVIYVYEKAKGIMDQDESLPSQITANMIVKEKRIFHWMTPVCETRQTKLESVLQWVSTSQY